MTAPSVPVSPRMSVREEEFDVTPTILEMNGERWAGRALLTRERQTTLDMFDMEVEKNRARMEKAKNPQTVTVESDRRHGGCR